MCVGGVGRGSAVLSRRIGGVRVYLGTGCLVRVWVCGGGKAVGCGRSGVKNVNSRVEESLQSM